jgi:hypothetical protein
MADVARYQSTWGRYLDPTGLRELYRGDGAPPVHVKGQHPPAGIDNMRLKTVDVFRIPGMGEYKVPFEGYFQVVRSNPSTPDWKTATVYVNFTDLKLFGTHEALGDITVDLNPNVLSGGNTYPGAGVNQGNVVCRINVAARFHVDKLSTVLFNKTPIQLKNDNVQGIPTIGEGGPAVVNSLPLYNVKQPEGDLFGYVEEVEYMVLNYITQPEAELYRAAQSFAEFKKLANPGS